MSIVYVAAERVGVIEISGNGIFGVSLQSAQPNQLLVFASQNECDILTVYRRRTVYRCIASAYRYQLQGRVKLKGVKKPYDLLACDDDKDDMCL
jgi:hypothetical protein